MNTNNKSPWDLETKYFYALTPEVIDHSLMARGVRPCGRVFALNSLENRVYEVEVSPALLLRPPFSPDSVVVKYYRPGRWSEEAILEEHAFLQELVELEIPVIAPLTFEGKTLFTCPSTDFYYAIFPKVRGRLKDELNPSEISEIGRLIARIHLAGATKKFTARPTMNPQNYVDVHFNHLSTVSFLPQQTLAYYLMVAKQLSQMIAPLFHHLSYQRIHGDLHRGNILWTAKDGPFVVDFDDTVFGPREQDLWQLFPGRDSYARKDQELFLEAYHSMAKEQISLPPLLIEALRSMRMIHFNGWIAKRWNDPIFKKIYSAFDSEAYWETELLGLKEQIGYLQDFIQNDSA
ncbi:MAG: serine/threonine protein kinase [Oligoflexia bacterium]|nr:serine/threonine protein kinase [Oligoflexia bacterium]MBF0365911.1 serine/threonine protein kinase [Oligoflexia bacterium]